MIRSKVFLIVSSVALTACGCEKYASSHSCSYVENQADYEVWYWRNVERDNEADNKPIGHATGITQCEDNARAYAASLNEPFKYQAYLCVLMKDGKRMEKHRRIL